MLHELKMLLGGMQDSRMKIVDAHIYFVDATSLEGIDDQWSGSDSVHCAGSIDIAFIAHQPLLQSTATIGEFNFVKGAWVAFFAGVMSACMAFAIAAGKPIANLAVAHGASPLWQNTSVFVVILAGGFTTNCVWCVYLNVRNRTGRDYLKTTETWILRNYVFSAAAGVIWYLQFMFYGMGTTKMGDYGFSSWTIHMAFIIVFSNLWGLMLHEWKGASRRTHQLIFLGIFVLIASTLVVGGGNYLATLGK